MTYGYKVKKTGSDWQLYDETATKWMPRRERRKATAKARQREQQRLLASLSMAAGIFAYPYGLSEAAIVDSEDKTLSASGKVYNINPQHESGDFAYNRFKTFNLEQGYIANLKFGSASMLANLVRDRITINGIVNAVRNNNIDGHLLFLSPNGIAVGATGVINAGQFTGVVPAQTDFDKLYNSANPAVDITKTAIEKLRDGSFAKGGTIDISGQINTHSGVILGAGIINLKDGAKIDSTKNLNFTNLVNINGGASAGLGSLTAVAGSGGDIILKAKQESVVKDTNEANPIRWSDRSTDITAAINIGKDEIAKGVAVASSDGAVRLTAESSSTYEDSTPMTLTDTLKGIVLGDDSKMLNGLTDKLAGKEAGANKYLFVNYSSKKNKASINIGENSAITGKNIDIAATSKVEIKQTITVPVGENKKDSEGNTVPNGAKAVAAVAVSRVYNTADVVIDGNLTAKNADTDGNAIKIVANADTKAAISATGKGSDANAVAVGVAVLTGDTKSKVAVNAPANATALSAKKGKASIEAITNSDVNINVGAEGNTSYVVSSVGVANYDTSADVTMDRSLTAGAVNIKAENGVTGLKMTVDNTVKAPSEGNKGKDTAAASDKDKQDDEAAATAEKNKPDSEKSEDEKKSEKKSGDPAKVIKDASVDPAKDEKTKDAAGTDGKGGVKDVKDKVEGTNEGGNNAAKTSAFGLGASVGVVSNQNDVNVTLGKNAVITAAKQDGAATADGSVNVAAKTLLTASTGKEDSLQFTVKNAQANSAKVEIGAAVLVSNVKNNAKILLDNEGDKSAQIKGSGTVKLDAQAGMGKYKKTEDKVETSVLSYTVNTEGAADKDRSATAILEGSVGINTQKNDAVVLLGQKSKIEGTEVSLSADAVTNVKGSYGAKEENSKVGIGATVGLQNIRGNSLLMAGKGVEITGTKSVSMTADNSFDAKNEVKNAGKGDSLGIAGMVALSYGDSNSILSLDDEVKVKAPEGVSMTATNATSVDNSARSESEGKESSKAFGIGVGIINYDVNNIVLVSDNGKGILAPSGSTTDAEKAAQKIYQDAALAQNIAGETFTAKLGQKTAANAEKGNIVTDSLTASAITTGSLQNDAKAKVVSKTAEDKSENANSRKDSEKWTQWSKKGKEGADEAKKNTEQLEQDKVEAQNESPAPPAAGAEKPKNNASQAAGEASKAANPDETPKDEGSAPAAGSSASAGASIGIEGSAALTFLGGRTDAILNHVTVKNETAEHAIAVVDTVKLSAMDILNTMTTGGTDIKNSVKSGNSATKVGIGGTFAMNSANRDVDSILRNSELQQVKSVANSASKVGIELAAGMGVTASKGNGTNVSGAGVVYYNKAKQDIHALMIDNTITAAENSTILNNAGSTDFQIAGGLAANSASGQGANVGVGGAVAISNLENNMSSGIIGGTYANKFQSVDVTAQKGTTQINGALAATFAGGKSGYGFEGAFAYGSVKNTTRAYISGAAGEGLKAETVNVKAGEIPLPDAEDSQAKKNKDLLTEKGIDTTGKQYLDENAVTSNLDAKATGTDAGNAANEAAQDENDAKAELGQNKNLIISAAIAGGWNGKAGVGAGISYNYVKNDIAADIKDSVIHAGNLSGEAASDSVIVSVGAGVAIGGKSFNGAGSGSWNDLKNDTKVTFANNTITGKTITEKAANSASIINVAGEVAGGQGSALGLSLAYNSLNNTTGTYLQGNAITLDKEVDNAITLEASNTGKALAVAAGVQVSATSSGLVGASGTVAINKGTNSTESVIDGKKEGNTFTNTKLDNVKNLSVKASDVTKKTTVAGGVSAGGTKVGIGGSVAYTAIGNSDNKEKLRAEINHADITTSVDGNIQVSAVDSKTDGSNLEKSRITTVGAGIGVAWGKNLLNLQGAAAVSELYKDTHAAINNTNINPQNSDAHPVIRVEADSKGKINTVGAVGDINVTGTVTGAAGIAINRLNQDITAEMATDSGKTTTVNAGLTQVRATGDSDIHSVGVGGAVSVAGQVAVAGSGSYNYQGNNVNALVKNQQLTANSSVGVVARSDDRIYNFAGGFSIGINSKAAIGAAVSINKITGNTNALVQGGSITAANTGSIKVTRPQDGKLFTTDTLALTTDSDKLSASREEKDKTGIVVDSSATHTLISQMASGGVAASSSVGVGLAGTVNLNTVKGDTAAKIENTAINSAVEDSNAFSDVNVNALDYTNFGTFTGTPSVGAAATAGVSVGVSANWETFDRKTTATLSSNRADDRNMVKAKDLTVNAVTKHGSSNLSFAAAVGAAATAGVASGDSIVRRNNTSETTALLKNTNVTFAGKADILAQHLANSRSKNISVSASGGYAAVAAGAGVSVMDDRSKVKAEVADSDLKETQKAVGDSDKKTISVQAMNENNWNSTLVTASAAIGLGAALAGNVGINTTTSETAATVSGASHLQATEVHVDATDTLNAKADGGVGTAGLAGVGVSVALNNINSSVSANVTGGTIQAAKDIQINAEEVRDFESVVAGAGIGGANVGVNVAVTSVNKGITDAQLSSARDEKGNLTNTDKTTKDEIKMHLGKVNSSKGAVGVEKGRFFGLSEEGKQDLAAAKNVNVNFTVPDTQKRGTHTLVQGASLQADGDVKVLAQEKNDISAKNVTVSVGGSAVGVTDAIIHTKYDTDVKVDQAAITGKSVAIEAKQGQQTDGSKVNITAVTVGAGLGVGVGYAGIVNNGSTDVDITNSTIGLTKGKDNVPDVVNADRVSIQALDESKSKADITNVGVAAVEVTTTFASVENNSNAGVTLGGMNTIAAKDNIAIDAKKANALEAHTQGVGAGGVAVAVNHATIVDKGNAVAKITGTDGTFKAKEFYLGATNDTTGKLSAGNTTVSVLGVSRMRGKGDMTLGAEVNVAGGSFDAKLVKFASQLGRSDGRTLEGNVKGHNVSAVAVAPDAVVLNTNATSKVIVKNSTFAKDADLILDNVSYVDRKAYIHGVTAGAVAVGNTSADISGKETLESSLTGKSGTTKLDNLLISTYGQNTGKAFADAGGGGIVGYVGAHVSNESTNNVSSTLSGNWETAGNVWLLASQGDETRLTASEGHGGVAGVGGTSVDNVINTTTKATVGSGAVINADRAYIGTSNAAVTGAYDDTDSKGAKDEQSYTLKDHFGGVISGNRLRSLMDITENGTVTIGKNAKITTNHLQEYLAASQNDLTNHVQAKGGGAVVVTDAVTENKINVHNKVDVQGGVVLSNEKAASAEEIVLSAYDNQSLKAHVDATVLAGVVSPIVAKNLTTMNRTSNVTVAGTIESGSNVGLYAGANKTGAQSNLKADLKAGAYNYSVIPITSPTVDYTITADKGTVDVSGTVRSTKDINAIASGGREEIAKDESKWAWTNGGSSTDKKFLTSDAVTADESSDKMKESIVNVTGTLIAGTADPINLIIKGSVADGLSIDAPNNVANNRVKNGIAEGTFDYANTLGARLAELDKLIAAYDGSKDNATVMASYIAERDRIQNKMKELGMVELDENGNVTSYVNSGRSVYYVEIPDIATSGGNINVRANNLTGTGKLRANTAPSVTIKNDSDAYLKLNNILMGEQGGKIVYNQDNVIPPSVEQGNKKINEINVRKSGASFNEIYGRTEGTAPELLVENTKTFSGGKTSTISLTPELEKEIDSSGLTAQEKEDYKNNIRAGKMTYTAITDVEVNGKISNFYGNVTIKNASGDIRINGGTKEHPTGVEGNTVSLIANNGTIAQDYKEGIVNINGDPEKYLVDKAEAMKTSLGLSETADDEKHQTAEYSRATDANTATGYIAGRDVYVSAANVNVNGLIQSGYKTYAATVTQADLDAAKTRPASKTAVVQNRTMYKVNEGGAKWNDTDKVFDYVPQVYWDPATDKLVVEDIDTQGGKVYLTGRIASTGDGKILAADGAAKISVTNETALDLNVGNVFNNQREGIITIADTAKNTWTEFKKGQTRTINGYADYLQEHAKDGNPYAGATKTANSLSVGNDLTYEVKGGQTYTWINGNSVETTATYEHYERFGMWGAVQTASEDSLKGWSQNSQPISVDDQKKLGLPEGAVIMQDSTAIPENGKLQLDGTTRLLNDRIFDREHNVRKSGFLGWFKHVTDRWKEGKSTIQLYNYTLNASLPVKVGLIGDEKGSIDIASTNAAGGNINLTGNVANSHHEAPLTVSSAAGSIFQNDNTTLKSEVVNLTAKEDIKNIQLASIGTAVKDTNGNITAVNDNIKLSAISTNKGDIDINVVGGILGNRSLPGNVEIVALKSQDGNAGFKNDAALGDITLKAAGNITQSGSGTTIEGRGIYLTSRKGGIGTETQAVQIAASDLVYATDRYGAQVNAGAKGSIYLTEAENGGNMRVGKIESKEGDVKLTLANGGFIDGLPGDDKSGSLEGVDNMVHRWIDAGLIDGEKDANGNYTYKGAYIEGLEKNRDDYRANVELAYTGKTQARWQKEYDDQKTAVENIYASAAYRTYLANKTKYEALSQEERRNLADRKDSAYLAYAKGAEQYAQYSKYETAEAYLKDTAAYKYSQYADANAYLAADAAYKDLQAKAANPKFEWTKDMMLYAISEKMVNPDTGSSAQTAREANVLGRNITLLATKGAVGTFAGQTKTITVEELEGNAGIAKMKELMNVSASDVKVKRDENGNLLSFEIKGNMPLGIHSSGILDVSAGGNVAVAGRTDAAGEHSAINVGHIDATQNSAAGDVRVHSEKGIYNALAEDAVNPTNITGKNLILTGGKESIGTAEKPITVFLSGDLPETRAEKNIFIKNMKADDYLRLGPMFAGDTISLTSEKGFKMSGSNTDIADSYINAGKKLEFNTNAATGIVGEKDNAIRILNDRATVNIAAESAHIHGLGSLTLGIQNGTLTLGNIQTQGEFTAVSEGSLSVGREVEKDANGKVKKEAVAGAIAAGGDVTLAAKDSLELDGRVKAEGKKLTLKAANGAIMQTGKGAITAAEVKTFNGKSLLLENKDNAFASIEVDGTETTTSAMPDIAGNVRIKDNADNLLVAIKRNVAGDISVGNLRANGTLANASDLTATGTIALGAQGTLSQAADTTIKAGKKVELTSAAADIQQAADAGIKAKAVTATSAKGVDLQGTGNAFQAIAVQGSQANKPIIGDVLVKANTDDLGLAVSPAVQGNIEVENRKVNGSIEVLSALQAKNNADALPDKGNISLTAGADVHIHKDITTGQIMPAPDKTFVVDMLLSDKAAYNSLTITAGGVVQEANGVKIEAPVVDTYTGKGVSLESIKNRFAIFVANGVDGNAQNINGSVKAVTNYGTDGTHNGIYVAGVSVNTVRGDVDFINLAEHGDVRFLTDNEIQVLGGNHAQTAPGSLRLTADNDITLLGDVYAKKDIVLASTGEGSIYGIGKMDAGNDVFMLAKNAIYYIGTMTAGNNIDAEVWNATSVKDGSGIHIGTMAAMLDRPADKETGLKAGKNMNFIVKGNGDIDLDGKLVAEAGKVMANVSGQGHIAIGQTDEKNEKTIMAKEDIHLSTGKGDISIVKGIESTNESIKLETGRGNITVGRENVRDEESLIANKSVSIGTNTGTITIQGHAITASGDISMKAGKDVYIQGIQNSNFIIKDDGMINSGGGINLYGRNGDIYITEKLNAKKGLTAAITERGSVAFGTDVNVTKDVNISTEKGTIDVGNTINSIEGTVNLTTGTGDIQIGKDITAEKAITISSHKGNVVIGNTETGDDGDVLVKNGDVSINTAKGNIEIVKTVTAQKGSIGIASRQGDILIGNNGPDVKTVTAGENIDLNTKEGKIVVYGKTSTENGDISLSAHRKEYVPGEDNSSFIIDQNGKLEAGRAIKLNVGNGDLHVSDRIHAKKDLVTELSEKGSLYFDTDVDVTGSVSVKTVEGDIHVGHDVVASKDIAMATAKGNIDVGAAVAAAEGNVNLATGQGNIAIGKEVRAERGSIGAQVGTGSVIIGNNGPDVETVTAQENINIGVDVGQVKIYGKTSTKTGDISMAAGANNYTPGAQNFIIEQNGLLESGRDIRLTGRNGDLHVTDAIQAKRNLYTQVHEQGSIFFDKTATLTGDVTVHTEKGQISIGGQVDANLVDLATGMGNIAVGGDIASDSIVSIQTNTGDINLQNIIAKDDIKVTAQDGNIHANNIISGKTTHVALESGDLFLNLAEGKAVLLKMENNTEASKVNQVLAVASGGTAPDVTLTGNFIQIGSLEAKDGDAAFELSAMGAGGKKLIAGNFYVGSLRSGKGTHMESLWSNRGYVHVAEGDIALDDVLAVDKIHLENEKTDLAVYGRTPTRDGEQLVYWNNLEMAYSKERAFQLYADGMLRTRKAVLVDAGRNYRKLYGDNLSVMDMMRERETHVHGEFTFDSTLLTAPVKTMKEVFFDMSPVETDFQQKRAADEEIVVD